MLTTVLGPGSSTVGQGTSAKDDDALWMRYSLILSYHNCKLNRKDGKDIWRESGVYSVRRPLVGRIALS